MFYTIPDVPAASSSLTAPEVLEDPFFHRKLRKGDLLRERSLRFAFSSALDT
jgi:hypothetical protein